MKTGSVSLKLDIAIERNGCVYVPWDLIKDKSIVPSWYADSWDDDLEVITSNTWTLIDPEEFECGDKVRIQGDMVIHFYKYWTDCGYEYDAEPEIQNEKVTKL